MTGWMAVLATLVYICGLFAVAHYGDTTGRRFLAGRVRPIVYALGLCIYCTSWTFFGSVGVASASGYNFLAIYIGPLLVIGLGGPALARIVHLAKGQNITSIADFIAARYGKAQSVAALVTLICVFATVPYIALQLKAISTSIAAVLSSIETSHYVPGFVSQNLLLAIAALLSGFAMAFGTRHVDATEHQGGLMLAIATESIVKLLAFILVGAFVTWGIFDGLGDLLVQSRSALGEQNPFAKSPEPVNFLTMALLSACAILLLPRQFHVTVVENRDVGDIKTASRLFSFYLIAINLFVIPLAMAGLVTFSAHAFDRDMTVLALPLQFDFDHIAVVTLIGGLSAATAMVIVECVALSTMISNDLVVPLFVRSGRAAETLRPGDIGAKILVVRRVAILAILALAYLYLVHAERAGLASIGLVAFACVAQIAPAFLGGLLWPRATGRGAIAGLISGTVLWAYTLLLPSFDPGSLPFGDVISRGPFDLTLLRPTAIFGTDMPVLVHGTFWSLLVNVAAFVTFSLTRSATRIERVQADYFVGKRTPSATHPLRLWRASVSSGELEALVARYLGAERTRDAFAEYLSHRGIPVSRDEPADVHLLRFAEHQLASAIGAASSRLVLSVLLKRGNVSRQTALRLVDDASAAILYNRDLLQYALDFARQGITVFDKDLRLICWNREFRELINLPSELVRVGVTAREIVAFNAERGLYGPGNTEAQVVVRLQAFTSEDEPSRVRLHPCGEVIEIRSARMPDGSLVTTYTDVTAQVVAEESLEKRVAERTEELMRLNIELARAKAEAEAANSSKTRFLAAASHDLLQPLNAARLYATSLSEGVAISRSAVAGEMRKLAHNVDLSLEAVEEILTTILEISRLDAGALKPELHAFPIDDVLEQLRIEFEPIAREKRLDLKVLPCSLPVLSDRRLLRRLLRNLVSNAVKYTPAQGRVLVGARRRPDGLRLEVWDTGVGIPEDQQKLVFQEFTRLESAQQTAAGLGLGLSIVERLGRVLDHPVDLRSLPARGSVFSVDVPAAAPSNAAEKSKLPRRVSRKEAMGGMVVVAIDNDPRILEGMRVLLEQWQCSAVCADTSAEVIVLLDEIAASPDVVLADYHLGEEENGLDAIARLREQFGMELPAILITADRTTEVRDRAGEENVYILHKPVKPASLRALLSQARVASTAAE
ncbi:MAG: hybrid sensor histidine kinase/response regulator [Methylobacteriaceae bacterium]|nr:hybrid sensor histidine kinase/response regulator [Methylobacteriaceae bacterium]